MLILIGGADRARVVIAAIEAKRRSDAGGRRPRRRREGAGGRLCGRPDRGAPGGDRAPLRALGRVLGRRRRRRLRRGRGGRRRRSGPAATPARSPASPSAGRTASTSPGCPRRPARRCSRDRHAVRDAAVVARTRAAGGVSVGKLAMHELAWGMMGWAHRRPSCPNPYDAGTDGRRLVDGVGGRRGHRPGRPRAGHGHRRVGARAGEPVRRRRHEADAGLACRSTAASRTRRASTRPGRSPARCATARVAVAVLAAHGTSQPPAEALDGVHIGVLERHFCEELDPGVEAAFRAALEALARAGAVLDTVDLGWQDDADVLLPHLPRASRCPWSARPCRPIPSAFGSDVVQDVTRGLGLHALDYLRALERLEARRRRALPALAEVDLVACPTVAVPPPPLLGQRRDPPPQPQHQAVQRARLAGHQPAVRAGRRGAAGRSPARGGARRGLAPPGAGDLRRGGARLAPRRARRRELTPLRRASAAARGRRRRGG